MKCIAEYRAIGANGTELIPWTRSNLIWGRGSHRRGGQPTESGIGVVVGDPDGEMAELVRGMPRFVESILKLQRSRDVHDRNVIVPKHYPELRFVEVAA